MPVTTPVPRWLPSEVHFKYTVSPTWMNLFSLRLYAFSVEAAMVYLLVGSMKSTPP